MDEKHELGRLMLKRLPKGRHVKELLGYKVDETIRNQFGRECKVFTLLVADEGPAILVYSYEGDIPGGSQVLDGWKPESARVYPKTAPASTKAAESTPATTA